MDKLFSDKYASLLNQLHNKKPHFGDSGRYKGLTKWMQKHNAKTAIDYGCGKGFVMESVKQDLPGVTVIGYDPGMPNFSSIPTEAVDVVYCTDVLEHIEPDMIDNVLKHIHSLFNKSAWFVIDTVPAKKHLPDGRNAHLIIENQEWWTNKIKENMPGIKFDENWFSKRRIVMELVKDGTN